MSEKHSNRLALALAGTSPERIAVEEAIYSALERWTGMRVTPGEGVPKIREGTVRLDRGTLLTGPDGGIIERIMRVAAIEGRAEILASLDRLRACEAAVRMASEAYANLEPIEKLGTWPPKLSGTVERRIIVALDPWVAFPTASDVVLEALVTKIENAEKNLAKFSSRAGRPRNEAAHRVAMQLAELYADVTARKPTYSESHDGLHGDYTPALRDLFNALGWRRIGLRGPAEAAIAEITDARLAEITSPNKMLFGGLFPAVPQS